MNRISCLTLLCFPALVACSGVTEEPPAPATPGAAWFEPEAPPSSPSIALELKGVTDGALMLDVVGRGIDDLYGLAFRVETDAAVLALEAFESSPRWASSRLVVRAVEARPGLGFYVITAQGSEPGIGADGDVLATIHLARKSAAGAPLRFVTARSAVVDHTEQPVPGVAFIGGTLHGEE